MALLVFQGSTLLKNDEPKIILPANAARSGFGLQNRKPYDIIVTLDGQEPTDSHGILWEADTEWGSVEGISDTDKGKVDTFFVTQEVRGLLIDTNVGDASALIHWIYFEISA